MSDASDEALIKAAQANCEALIKHLLSFSLNLVRLKGRKEFTEPCGLSTGFLVQKDNRHFVLSAGHSMRRKSQWFWETDGILQPDRQTLCVPVGPFNMLGIGHARSYIKHDSLNSYISSTCFNRHPSGIMLRGEPRKRTESR